MVKQAIALFLTLTLVSTSGCSFAFMTRAPEPVPAPNYPVDCTSSTAAPVLDTICAAYFVANTAYISTIPDCNSAGYGNDCVEEKGTGMALNVGLAALCLAGAVSGYGKAARCQAVKNQNALCITGNREACGALNPTWRPQMQQQPAPASWLPAAPPVAPPAAPAAAPAPEQRPDGLPHGANCTATWQCATGLACSAGRCVAQ
jgi:hypothetical protein